MKFTCNFRDCNAEAKYQYAKLKVDRNIQKVTLTWRCEKHRKKTKVIVVEKTEMVK